ncbi:glutamate-5-semialdehyde dehydrogenase [Megasphaera massiliensis]|uniref:Gamma-glutamyl phosphate reductase n=1 Tax=Megasphaera massiliensis TaxID=1232428 RepID=A0ABT1STK6_9FIRM|nr:glutamate-5-semialdehyde dehydrogenase [Megasphaera sp.]MCB6234092.1 glutamate-5-semialdehyde dehydrogenase [Megasphaera massiliensis]MCB6386511.1 glutamate-5-semialdehyde dehydrogenase [Megasphaera massiliensis]MCB6400602.1 glutamate-5-semialdehyde dehydrogenase [Megasphaera massiliensis]MCB6404861.1 glutamate-5-semialdehyde dehydrogenase [Megasphaera massiliensis]
MSEVYRKGRDAKEASYVLQTAGTDVKNKALAYIADALMAHSDAILSANAEDLKRAKEKGMAPAMVDRLTLTKERISAMAEGVRQVIDLRDPSGIVLDEFTRPNGLAIKKVSVPLGVIAIIFESRPNVTVDAAALCIKAGNACVLRGGSEAIASNTALTSVIRQGLKAAGLPENSVNIIENTDRALVKELLTLRGFIDLAIPRGGAGLIRMVVDTATVPCIETGSGVCHVYVDKDADLSMAVKIVENAKVSRPSTCNAMETLLVHRDVAKDFLETLAPVMKDDAVELRGDDEARAVSAMKAADDEDWATEYNSLIMSVKVVDSLDEALDHIRRFSTHHSEAIVTNNKETAEAFQKSVDSAAVYVNASTRFTDGFEFGFGAEIGISTQKLHVRGPMGLEALVSYKYLIDGQGQIR